MFFFVLLAGVAGLRAGVETGNPADLAAQPLSEKSGPRGATLFAELSPTQTGFVAENRYTDPRIWGELFHEFEVGAIGTGVAVGDYDLDGRPDIFVVSKTETCRLFRNLGNWKFEDVTERAGVTDKGTAAQIWKQGAAFADVNNDGLLDLYVCRFAAPNLLYINQGNGTFLEKARDSGLDVTDASGMAAFNDYDRDGWLDVYIQTNLLKNAEHPNGQRDYLFRNNRDGTFTNVTDHAGVSGETQGHSATWWDYNNDDWPDLYVANDFAAPDCLYRNNRDGTFTDVLDEVVPHTPFSSMGSDIGDVNNDGLLDFFVPDMAATTHERDQRAMAEVRSRARDAAGPSVPQYPRASLFINTGTGRSLEAAYLANLAATDWAWSVRFEDLDNDGRLDLHITNGMHREIHNTDLMQRMLAAESPGERVRLARASPVLADRNLAFRNTGELIFENVSGAWGLDQKGVSFGSAFGDFDGDGDLDLVYSNYEAPPTLLRNDSDSGHRVVIALRGTTSNRYGVGATVRIESEAGVQVRQLVLARGYLSTSEPVLHFGLGNDRSIKSLTVSWPSGQIQNFKDLPVDRHFTFTEPKAPVSIPAGPPARRPAQFTEVSAQSGLSVLARENEVDEISLQSLLPTRLNRRGPSAAFADLDGDGKDELIVGGTTVDPTRILIQNLPMHFSDASGAGVVLPSSPGTVNDGPVLVFDANGDGINDLLVTRGGAALPIGSPEYQPQLYFGTGPGGFTRAPAESLPSLLISVGAVAAADFDRDGQLDLFVGGRLKPGEYPLPPPSALLRNRGGNFEDVTDTLAPRLREAGMVTSALWSDVDGDGWIDLLLALEWGGVKYFHNQQGRSFEDLSASAGFATAGTGFWNSLAAADFNGDGRLDYAAGNLGLNTSYRATPEHPALAFYGEFSEGAAPQLIEGYYEGDRLLPRRTRRQLGAKIPAILKKYPRNDFYARATLGELVGEERLAAADRLAATEFRSGVFMSQPDGRFRFEALPTLAQIAPIQGAVAGDFDGDGKADIYAVQNSYAPIPAVGRFDGGLSILLRGDAQGHFRSVPLLESGLIVPGDAKALAVSDLDQDGWPDFFITRNNDTSLAFRNQGVVSHHSLRVILRGPVGNPAAIGARVTLEQQDGSIQTSEVYGGSGYYSQSTAACFFGYADANPPRIIPGSLAIWRYNHSRVPPVHGWNDYFESAALLMMISRRGM